MSCATDEVSDIVGVAFDGFPIYGPTQYYSASENKIYIEAVDNIQYKSRIGDRTVYSRMPSLYWKSGSTWDYNSTFKFYNQEQNDGIKISLISSSTGKQSLICSSFWGIDQAIL